MKRVFGKCRSYLLKTIAMCVGYIFYNRRYLKGNEFDKKTYSSGWKFVMHDVFYQKIIGIQRNIPFPVAPWCQVVGWENIEFDLNTVGIFQRPGCYFQASGAKIKIGEGTYLAGGIGIITANHNIYNLKEHLPGKDVVIGKNCWIGMNSVILPGVVLGDHTVVGAGSIVTKPFEDGYCVIAGNPAKVIRTLDKEKFNEG